VTGRDDGDATAGKPVCDYDDGAARTQLVDALAKDGTAVLAVLAGRELDPGLAQAGALLAAVRGQDLDFGQDGVFTVARRVAPDRVISTVDPQAAMTAGWGSVGGSLAGPGVVRSGVAESLAGAASRLVVRWGRVSRRCGFCCRHRRRRG